MPILIALAAGLVGVIAGGVVNVLADDLPARRQPGLPHYPDGTPRSPVAWLGLAAFLSGRRCPPGGSPTTSQRTCLGWRHPIVEIGLGLAFVALALAYRDEQNVLAWFVYVAVFGLITVIDIEHRLILFVVSLPACAFALAVAAISPGGRSFGEYVLGGAFGFGLFFIMFLGGILFTRATQRDEVAFGFGDVMLATLSGLILGWRAFLFAAFITVFAGAIGGLLVMAGRSLMGRRYRWFTPLPYGPYIVLGTLIMLLFRDEVRQLLGGTY